MIVHIAEAPAWRAAQELGEYRPASLAAQGFIHCSTAGQVARVANDIYRSRSDLVLLWIDPSKLRPALRYEDGGNGELFPHLYGPLNLDAIGTTGEFAPRPDGRFDDPHVPPLQEMTPADGGNAA